MLDAQPAATAPARPPAIQQLQPSPAIADTTGVRSKPAALLAAATALLPELEVGRALDPKTLREAMSAAFGASDTQGAWVWKDAYEAAEAAMVLFIQRYGRLMRREAGAGPGSAAAMLAMLETLAALEPSQTRRSEEQLALQQFSTPLPLAYAALQAAAIRPGDIVLEPSAGTGMLAVMAECALGKRTDDARSGDPLHLNEIAAVRAGLLARLFPDSPVTRHNAESIADYLPDLRPTVVLMNPPFSASPGVQRIRHDADLRHLHSAFSMLPAGGRLVAITSAGCIPGDAAWSRAFERLDPPPRTVFSNAIDGRAYARRGTTFDTRLTVIDRDPANAQGVPVDARESVPTAAGLLAAIAANVPQRQAVVPIAAALVPAGDLFGHAAALSDRAGEVCLLLGLTAVPESMRSTAESLDMSVVSVIARAEYLGNGALGHPDDGAPFRQRIQELLHRLRDMHGVQTVHVLPCASNAACVFFGQAFDSYHPDLLIYDFVSEGNGMVPRLGITNVDNECIVKTAGVER